MKNTIKFSVDLKNSGKRLDVYLAENLKELSRSFLKRLIERLAFPQKNKTNIVNRFTGVNVKTISLNGSKKSKIEPKMLKKNIKKHTASILFLNMWY